ncbi:MAG: NUDIX domain-containing protein [Treponema sp.]|uniref:8-oxo-dGTP diphosphatase n=1 Tax=Treponema rectale TaxID=744512 RepID=A0A840S7H9_9SPIR|nr:NUDIX domain-containing protein [Treponema rectale]MBB5218549.1 8-oxo-dGTP diphosphatase [Treponema rectale]MBO6176370.1 NUDIX domain-containing protein [Treponema sp.]QOS39768.1 NUDIX domain-containing protein [Treponema rectale]
MSKISVVCLCVRDGKVFIAKRNPVGQMGNRWEFPGGKVEKNESDESAIIREMKEEFGIDVTIVNRICKKNFINCDVNLELHVYEVSFPHDGLEKRFTLSEHSEYRWVFFSDIDKNCFVDSDFSIMDICKNYFESKR